MTTKPERIPTEVFDAIAELRHTRQTDIVREIRLALDHPSRPDSMPASTPGAAPASGRSTDDPATATERAALTPVGDRHKRLVLSILDALHRIDTERRTILGCLTQIDSLRSQHGGSLDPPPGCRALARIGAWEPVAHTITLNGDRWPLGTWAYGFHSRNGRLPTPEECEQYTRTGRVYVKAS